MPNIKLVTFDLDGTLADTSPELLAAMNDARRHLGLPDITMDVLISGLNSGVMLLIRTCFPELQSEEEIENAYKVYRSYYAVRCLDTKECYDGIHECIDRLVSAGIQVAVITNKMTAMTEQMIPILFPNSPFFRVIGADSGYPRKPDPASINALMAEAGATPEETVHVGDSDIDMLTARAAGVFGYGVAWGFVKETILRSVGASKIAHHASEIADFILDEG